MLKQMLLHKPQEMALVLTAQKKNFTTSPCYNCFKLIANSSINKIYYNECYRDDRIIKYALEANIELIAMD